MTGTGPHAIVMEACKWIAADRRRWDALVALCRRWHAENPGLRLMRGDLFVRAQDMGMEITQAEELCKRDNTLWSVLSRYVVMVDPRLSRCIHHRRAAVDGVDLRAAWRLFVDEDDSCLVCDGWRQAVALRDLEDAMGGAA